MRVVKLPWAEPSSRYTARFEVLAIEWLEEASQNAVGEQWGLSCDEIHGIMDRAVERGRERRQAESVPKMRVDAKAFRKGHSYFTLVNDLVRGRMLYVAEGRQQASLDGFLKTLSEKKKQSIEAVDRVRGWEQKTLKVAGDERGRWIDQRQDLVGEVHRKEIPEQAELCPCHLHPRWWPGPCSRFH